MSKVILVAAAHSDDEAIGCSGTIARHIDEGDAVHVVFMTDGVSSRGIQKQEVRKRKASSQIAIKILGIQSVQNFDFADNGMDEVPLLDIVKVLENVVETLQPEIIYTHHANDLNIDHQIVHNAVMTVCRPQPKFCVKEIYAFEVLSSTDWQTPSRQTFVPNVFVDITSFIEIKKQVLNAYKTELRPPPHTRSIQNILRLNALRGNTVGVDYAEAFELLRCIR